uniref:Molybdenum cofactor sulfurase domain containing protein n=1 Tax=Haemonchus contortus TaxID=6289 RepID=W6NLF6_HAECO
MKLVRSHSNKETGPDLTEAVWTHAPEVSSKNFRPVIVVDYCAAWDEDKWIDLQIGEARLQCFKPCTRCVFTTIDPSTGVIDNELQKLKKLRQLRLAPEGPMRQQFKDSPIFGVNAGVDKSVS